MGLAVGNLLRGRRRIALAASLALATCAATAWAALAPGGAAAPLVAAAPPGSANVAEDGLRSHPTVVDALAPSESAPVSSAASVGLTGATAGSSAQAPSTAEVARELKAFRKDLATVSSVYGAPGQILPDGRAVVPPGVPAVVAAVIAAGNEIATRPYLWGGGHGGWSDTGYDCSGSVSFALAGAGLLDRPLVSGEFMSWGDPGPGRWITIYANPGHVWMTVAGLRFDTAGETTGTRWQHGTDPGSGFVVRHPPGL